MREELGKKRARAHQEIVWRTYYAQEELETLSLEFLNLTRQSSIQTRLILNAWFNQL